MGDRMRSRDWVWTYHGESVEDLKQHITDNEARWKAEAGLVYQVIGTEQGEEKKTPHFQGYTSWKTTKSKKQMYKWVTDRTDKRFWVDKRKGKPEQAATYCKKEGDVWEFGTLPMGQGKRTDLDGTAESLCDGANLRDVIDERRTQAVQYAKIWLTYNEESRNFPTTVMWFWGVSGGGKTYAMNRQIENLEYTDEDIYRLKMPEIGTKLWWDGYDKHKCVVIDDYRSWAMSLRELITVLDGPCRVEVKGAFRQLLAKHVFITTDKSPEEMYSNSGEELYQLTRRIFHTRHFSQRFVEG